MKSIFIRLVLALALAMGAFPLDGVRYLLTPLGIYTPIIKVEAVSSLRGDGCQGVVSGTSGTCVLAGTDVDVGDVCMGLDGVRDSATATIASAADFDTTDVVAATWTAQAPVTGTGGHTTTGSMFAVIATSGAGGTVSATWSSSASSLLIMQCFVPTGSPASLSLANSSLTQDTTTDPTELGIGCGSITADDGDALISMAISQSGGFGAPTAGSPFTALQAASRNFSQYYIVTGGGYSGDAAWTMASGTGNESMDCYIFRAREVAGGGGFTLKGQLLLNDVGK